MKKKSTPSARPARKRTVGTRRSRVAANGAPIETTVAVQHLPSEIYIGTGSRKSRLHALIRGVVGTLPNISTVRTLNMMRPRLSIGTIFGGPRLRYL